jgi:hypothetical protein
MYGKGWCGEGKRVDIPSASPKRESFTINSPAWTMHTVLRQQGNLRVYSTCSDRADDPFGLVLAEAPLTSLCSSWCNSKAFCFT